MLNNKLAHPPGLAPPPLGNPGSGPVIASSDYFVKKNQKNNKQECIPVGCVPPAH